MLTIGCLEHPDARSLYLPFVDDAVGAAADGQPGV
jgi:hypothetical protein